MPDNKNIDLYDDKNYQGGYDVSKKLCERQRKVKDLEKDSEGPESVYSGKITGDGKKININPSY